MNTKDIEKLKKILLASKEQIEKDLADIDEGKEVKFPQYGDKLDENAQEVGDYETNLATDENLEEALRDIKSALKRIEKGEYGICKYCSQEIALKRLEARPVASSCVACKMKLQG